VISFTASSIQQMHWTGNSFIKYQKKKNSFIMDSANKNTLNRLMMGV